MVRSQRRWNILFLSVSAHNTKRFEQFFFSPTGLPDSIAHLPTLTRNTLLVPGNGEAHNWREGTHDSRIAAKDFKLSGFETCFVCEKELTMVNKISQIFK